MLLDKITAMESDLSKIQEDARRQRDQVPQKTTQAITPEPPTKSQSTIKTQTTSSPYMKVVASSIGLGALSKNRTRVAPLRSQPSAPRSRVSVPYQTYPFPLHSFIIFIIIIIRFT